MGIFQLFILFGSFFSLLVLTNAGDDNRIYTFAFSNDGRPANYVDKGVLVGQSVELVTEVCRFAGKKCENALVHRDQCWDSVHGYPPFSAALNGRWFDVCANLPWSSERGMNYKFPENAFFNTDKVSLLVKSNANISFDDMLECNDFTLAFPANTALEPDCLLDLGLFILPENYRPVVLQGDLRQIMGGIIDMVRNSEVDMALAITRFQGPRLNGVKALNANFEKIDCISEISDGLNMMMRSDDEDTIKWWDKALQEYMCTDAYEEFCKIMQTKYNADPLCRKPGVHIDCSKYGGPSLKAKKKPQVNRINPCINLECVFQEKLRYGSNYFKVHDDREGGAEKALKGSKDAHKGLSKKAINIGITSVDEQLFRVDKLCVTVNNAKNIKFIFRGGERDAEELSVPLDVEKEWSLHCVREQGYRKSIRLEFNPVGKLQAKKDRRIRIRDLEMDACLD